MKQLLIALTFVAMAFTSCKQSEGVDATQAVLDNIAARTSVRAYTSGPVPDEMVETLLRAAMAAPSAMNRQPWEFVVVNDRAVLDSLAGKLRYAKMLVQAPLAIVVCAETMITHRDGSQSENGLWEHDASAATQNILLAAKALGAKPGRIISRHILPNCISVIIISTALQIPSAIFTESYLSFIGLGVQVPMPSLGSLANAAREGLQSYPYKLVFPAIMICLVVLSLNLLGDGLRDAFDPKLKR